MKPGRSGSRPKSLTTSFDVKHLSYTLWFGCKHLNRKLKRVLRTSKVGNIWLPQEIVDIIVGHVSDDRDTLFACTHLSRTWCIAARSHLHRNFTISSAEDFQSVEDLQNLGIVHLVRKVLVAQMFNQSDYLSSQNLTHFHAFTHLQELSIKYLDIGELLVWLHQHCDILRSTVRTLTLLYPRCSIKQLICFIGLFSNLENLAVNSIDSVDLHESQVPVMEGSPPLTGRLSLSGILDQQFLSALAWMPNGLGFRTVDMQFCGDAQEIIDACAGTITRLIYYPPSLHDLRNLNLSRCESLRHVEVTLSSVTRAFPNDSFPDFISVIPPVQQLETFLVMSYDNDLERLRQALCVTPSPNVPKKEKKARRDVKVSFGLYIEEGEAEEHRESARDALDCAISNGVFEFSKIAPTIEVYPRCSQLVSVS